MTPEQKQRYNAFVNELRDFEKRFDEFIEALEDKEVRDIFQYVSSGLSEFYQFSEQAEDEFYKLKERRKKYPGMTQEQIWKEEAKNRPQRKLEDDLQPFNIFKREYK